LQLNKTKDEELQKSGLDGGLNEQKEQELRNLLSQAQRDVEKNRSAAAKAERERRCLLAQARPSCVSANPR
jgi:hypothetical protein